MSGSPLSSIDSFVAKSRSFTIDQGSPVIGSRQSAIVENDRSRFGTPEGFLAPAKRSLPRKSGGQQRMRYKKAIFSCLWSMEKRVSPQSTRTLRGRCANQEN